MPSCRCIAVALVVACRSSPAPTPAPSPPAPTPPPSAHHDHHFRDADRWAAQFDAPDREAWQQPARVVELAGIAPGDHVADLGTGTGYFLPHLARAVGSHGKVLALDSEPAMVEHVKQRIAREQLATVEPRLVRPDDPGLAPASVHKILVVNTWHHIADRAAYARKLVAAMSPCSTTTNAIIVVDFTLDSPYGPPKHMRLSPEAAAEELRAAGLEPRIATESLPHQYVVIGTLSPPARCSAR